MGKCGRDGQTTDDNITQPSALHAGYLRLQTHTHYICNTCCFSTATIVTQTHLNITWHVRYLSCFTLPYTRLFSLAASEHAFLSCPASSHGCNIW